MNRLKEIRNMDRNLKSIDQDFIDILSFEQYNKLGVNRKYLHCMNLNELIKISKSKKIKELWLESKYYYMQNKLKIVE